LLLSKITIHFQSSIDQRLLRNPNKFCELINMNVLCIGSDIAGSIRTPASFCSLFAHKPTSGLMKSDVGPMCRYAEDLMPIFRVLVGDQFELYDKLLLDEEVI